MSHVVALSVQEMSSSLVLNTTELIKLAQRIDAGQSSLSWSDLYTTQYILDCHGEHEPGPLVFAALALAQLSARGQVKLSLSELGAHSVKGLPTPIYGQEEWLRYLAQSNAVAVLGASGLPEHQQLTGQGVLAFDEPKAKPLILNQGELYLSRQWTLQRRVDDWFNSRLNKPVALTSSALLDLGARLRGLFELESCSEQVDWQACAAAQALTQQICLISGGPGTGKTTTAAKILELLAYQHFAQQALPAKIRLLAPTGKAAIRLFQSIQNKLVDQGGLVCLPENGETIHRFLHGYARKTSEKLESVLASRNQHYADIDILLIDEASMIDLALMARLVEILPEKTRVILMGDHYQLPAVEPGQIFSAWVSRFESEAYGKAQAKVLSSLLACSESMLSTASATENTQPLCQLKKTYRFDGELKHVADLIKRAEVSLLLAEFDGDQKSDVEGGRVAWNALEQNALYQHLINANKSYFDLVRKKAPIPDLVEAFNDFQLLCSTHEGAYGTRLINAFIERHFGMNPDHLYHGKAILVNQNYAEHGVFNGDIGFCIEHAPKGYLFVFPCGSGQFIELAPSSIRSWQSAFAISVHKSQGSEYNHVSLILPDYAKELLTKSMLYTGVTRAKESVGIWVDRSALVSALS